MCVLSHVIHYHVYIHQMDIHTIHIMHVISDCQLVRVLMVNPRKQNKNVFCTRLHEKPTGNEIHNAEVCVCVSVCLCVCVSVCVCVCLCVCV